MLRRLRVTALERRASRRKPKICSNVSPIRTDQLGILEHVLQLQLELGNRLRLIERDQRPAIGQRYQDHSGAPLQRAARMDHDDGVAAKGGELRRTRAAR